MHALKNRSNPSRTFIDDQKLFIQDFFYKCGFSATNFKKDTQTNLSTSYRSTLTSNLRSETIKLHHVRNEPLCGKIVIQNGVYTLYMFMDDDRTVYICLIKKNQSKQTNYTQQKHLRWRENKNGERTRNNQDLDWSTTFTFSTWKTIFENNLNNKIYTLTCDDNWFKRIGLLSK